MDQQLNFWGIQTCDCGRTATIVQETIFGEEHYCPACYATMTEEKEELLKDA